MDNTNVYDNEYKKFVDSIRGITSNTIILNEADNKQDNDDNNVDLDALLKDDAGLNDDNSSSNDNKDSSDKDELNDLNFDDLGKDNNDSNDGGKESDDLSNLDNEEPKEEENKFETDSEGLMDTITRLTKAGHTVKIVVSAEGREYLFNDKKVNGKQLKELAEMILPDIKGGKKLQKNFNAALAEEISSIKKELKELKSGKLMRPLKENKVIKIYENDYNTLIEHNEDMARLLEEKDAIIKNFESINSFNELESAFDKDMMGVMDQLSESMDEINKVTLDTSVKEASCNSYARGTDIALNVINENIMPLLNSLHDTKAKILAEMDTNYNLSNIMKIVSSKLNTINENKSYHSVEKVIPDDINTSLSKLSNITESINQVNKLDKLHTLMENKLKYKKSFSGAEVMRLLTEASDLVAFDNNPDYSDSIPKYDSFEERVQKTINAALAGRNKSDISVIPDDDGNLIKRNEIDKFDLPIKRDNFNPNTTVKSAIMQLAESLTDIDGKLNIDLCKKAYLYQKVKNPTTMKDFAIPIALLDENDGKLYAHPKLIEFAANMLSSDKSMRTYGITSRRELEILRESLMPYLKELKIEAPWAVDPNDNFSKTNKKKESTK